jgi:phytanoyl-CoA hydroxylase
MRELESIRKRFDSDGVVHVPGFLSLEQVGELDHHLQRYIAEIVPDLPAADAFYEVAGEQRALKQLQRLSDHDSYFNALRQRNEYVDLAEQLLDGPVRLQGVEWFNKPARIGKPTPPHQDGFYFCLRPDEALTIWIALDDVDEENGCVRYLPGSHRKGIRPHGRSEVLGFSQAILDFDPRTASPAFLGIVHRGDALVHHSSTIHWATGNGSGRERRALAMVFYSERAQRDEEAFARYLESSRSQQRALGAL